MTYDRHVLISSFCVQQNVCSKFYQRSKDTVQQHKGSSGWVVVAPPIVLLSEVEGCFTGAEVELQLPLLDTLTHCTEPLSKQGTCVLCTLTLNDPFNPCNMIRPVLLVAAAQIIIARDPLV